MSAPSGRITGLRHADHIAFTVPDLDLAVRFFVEHLGAETLYRSRRGPDPVFIPENFQMPPDTAFELAMLRLPPNLNVELFQWAGQGLRTEPPRHGDAGGHHLAFVVDDVDAAVDYLRTVPGVRVLGRVKQVSQDSPRVAGNRWTYVMTPWGLMLELVDRSRVKDPPRLVGPSEWRQA